MVNKKKNMFWVDATELVPSLDFIVITDTKFNAELVDHFYKFENHEIDYELVVMLGLGVVKNLHMDNDYYIYNCSNDQPDNFGFMNEVTRIGVYYQITHPYYDDTELEKLIIDNKVGREFLKKLQCVDSDLPYNRLKQIIDSKKGNVIQFN